MSYSISYSKDAVKVLKKWKKPNPVAFNKLYKQLPELEEHPKTGTGHPEALVGGNGMTYSRCLTACDRMIYDVYEETVRVLVIELEGHYDDK